MYKIKSYKNITTEAEKLLKLSYCCEKCCLSTYMRNDGLMVLFNCGILLWIIRIDKQQRVDIKYFRENRQNIK